MAFQAQRIGQSYHALAIGNSGGVMAKSESRRFSSSNEIAGAQGELLAIVYSGEELQTTETTLGSSLTNVSASGNQVTTRSSVKMSNEDVTKQEVEKITFTF